MSHISLKKFVVVAVVVLLASLAGGVPAKALSQFGPDPNDFEPAQAGDQFTYGVSSVVHEYASIPQTSMNVYFTNNTGTKTITIIGADLCTDASYSALNGTGGNIWDRPNDDDPGPGTWLGGWSNGNVATTYFIQSGGYTSPVVSGLFSGSDTCYKDTRQLSFPGSALVFDDDTGLYKADFSGVITPGYVQMGNYFHIKLSDADATVGYDSGVPATSFGMARELPRTGYRDYLLPFAPDCSVDTVQPASAYWYDDDNGTLGTNPEPLWIQLQKYRRDNGAYAGTVPLSFTGAQSILPGPVPDSYYPFSGNKQQVTMNFTVDPQFKYIWRWNHVWYKNVLQFRLPFDSIYFKTGCQLPSATVQPSTTVEDKVSFPGTAHFAHYVNVSNFQTAGNVNYTVQRYRNGVAEGGAQTGSYHFTGNSPPAFSLLNNTYNTSAADAGDRICERLTLSEPAGQGLNIVGNPSEACTVVVARPYLTVTNNDVWAGGRFDYTNSSCVGALPRFSKISSWVTSGAGAVGEYGIFALGPVLDFGSGRLPAGKGLTFANTPTSGNLGAATRCMANYYSAIGTTGADPWPGTGAVPANAGKKKYTVTGNVDLGTWTVPAGTQVVLLATGTVTITGDISYAGSFTGGDNISSLWIVSQGNINIQNNVTKVSGFLVAQGTAAAPGKIQTCTQPGVATTFATLTIGLCGAQLEVFGALKADQIYWQRTAGSAGTGTHAETVQFDPGLYLASPLLSTAAQLDLQDTKELPPVY